MAAKKTTSARVKLEAMLVTIGLAKTRPAARLLIKQGKVSVNGSINRNRDLRVGPGDTVVIAPEGTPESLTKAKPVKAANPVKAAKPTKAKSAKPAEPKATTGRAGVDWAAAGRKAYETRMRNKAAREAEAAAGVSASA